MFGRKGNAPDRRKGADLMDQVSEFEFPRYN